MLLALIADNAGAAQIAVSEDCLFVNLSGEIDRATPILLRRSLESRRCKIDAEGRSGINIWLDSAGGDVDAAMEVGRVLRKWQARAMVDKDAHCASACVLALLGGVWRAVSGTVGLHRPYSTTPSSSADEAAIMYRSMRAKLQGYFQEMNIPDRLLDAMNAVGPQQIRWLSGERDQKELEELWIQGNDPVWEDLQLSKRAEELNIT